MGFTLETPDGRSLNVNAWNWGALHEAVAAGNIFAEEEWAGARFNGAFELDPAQVKTLADFLEHEVLPALVPGDRLLLNGTVTSEPDDGTFHRSEGELWRNYGLRQDVLVGVIAFLRAANGPVTIG